MFCLILVSVLIRSLSPIYHDLCLYGIDGLLAYNFMNCINTILYIIRIYIKRILLPHFSRLLWYHILINSSVNNGNIYFRKGFHFYLTSPIYLYVRVYIDSSIFTKHYFQNLFSGLVSVHLANFVKNYRDVLKTHVAVILQNIIPVTKYLRIYYFLTNSLNAPEWKVFNGKYSVVRSTIWKSSCLNIRKFEFVILFSFVLNRY